MLDGLAEEDTGPAEAEVAIGAQNACGDDERFDAPLVDHEVAAAAAETAEWSRLHIYHEPEQEPSAEEYLAQAAQQASADAELVPPPEKRFARGSPERGLSSALHRQGAAPAVELVHTKTRETTHPQAAKLAATAIKRMAGA